MATDQRRPVATWLTPDQFELLRIIACSHNVSTAAYLRAVIIDVLTEERGKVPIPRRRLQGNLLSPL